MASTFTSNLVLELIATGEQSGSWGATLNTEVITKIDTAVAGRLALSVAGSSDVTLTAAQSLNAIHEYTGAITANINVIVPTVNKLFFIYNNTSGAFTLTVKTSAGTGVAVAQGAKTILYSDGTNVVSATDLLLTTGGTVTGAVRFSAASLNLAKGANITAAATTVLDTAGNYFNIVGTGTIVSFGTASAGAERTVQFIPDGTVAFYADGTRIHGLGTGTITSATGDIAKMVSDGGGTYRITQYMERAFQPRDNVRTTGTNTWRAGQRGYYGTIADVAPAGTLAVNMGTAINFVCTMTNTGTATRLLGNPSNIVAGQSGLFEFVQPAGGNALLSFQSNYRFAGTSTITLTTNVGSTRDVLAYSVLNDGTSVMLSPSKAVG